MGFTTPGPSIQGKFWAPKYKGQETVSLPHLIVHCEEASSEFSWGGGGEYLNSDKTTATGKEAYLKCSVTGDMNATCSHAAVPPWGPGTATSGPICVFDAELSSPVVSEAEEETKPTFVGEGCQKEFTLSLMHGSGSLPTPPSPGTSGNDPHWQLTLSVDGPPGLAFYDADTGDELTSLTWGWKWVAPHYYPPPQVPGHWEEQPGGLQPPTSVKVGLAPAAPYTYGAPAFVSLGLTVKDHDFPETGAGDRVMVVAVAITKAPNRSVGQDDRNLWFFGIQQGDPDKLVQPAHYPVQMTLSASDMPGVPGSGSFLYHYDATYNGTGKVWFDHVNGPSTGWPCPQGVNSALVFAQHASSPAKDIEVKLTIDNQDAAIAKLGVYSPASIELDPASPSHSAVPGGFETLYFTRVLDQLLNPIVDEITMEVREELGQMQPADGVTTDWTTLEPNQWGTWWVTGPNGVKPWIADQFGFHGHYDPQPVGPEHPLASLPVADMSQKYFAGTTVAQILDDPGVGPGVEIESHLVHWYRGKARWDNPN